MRGIDDPVEVKTRPAKVMDSFLEADARIEKKLPGGAGDDERERERIEIDRSQDAFAADLLIQQDCERQAEHEAEDDVEPAEQDHVDEGRVPVRWRVNLERPVPKLDVVPPADEIEVGEGFGVRERDQNRPKVEAVDEDEHQCEGRRENQPRKPVAKTIPEARAWSLDRVSDDGVDRRSHAHLLPRTFPWLAAQTFSRAGGRRSLAITSRR